MVIDFTPHQKLRGKEQTDPENLQSDGLQSPAKMECNGSHDLEGTSESDPASSSLLLMPGSLLIFKDQAYTGQDWFCFFFSLDRHLSSEEVFDIEYNSQTTYMAYKTMSYII